MEINTLSYKFFDQNGGSFELFVDGVELAKQVDFDDTLIPFWIIDKGIPTFPPHQKIEQIGGRIVAVCSSGEYGCDCLICRIEIKDDFVTLNDFERPSYSRIVNKIFIFTKENFREVESQLSVDAEKIRKSFEKKS